MKSIKKIILLALSTSLGLAFVSCNDTNTPVDINVEFNDATLVADGNEKTIEIEGSLPDGYSVSYVNNKASQAGDYYATANIENKKGEVVQTLYATLTIDNPDSESFEKYLDQFLIEYLEEDQISISILVENPSALGLEHYDASWYIYDGVTDQDLLDAKNDFEERLADLEKFDYSTLSSRQKISYTQIKKFFNYYVEYYGIKNVFFLELNYVDQFGGYVADFESTVDGMRIPDKQGVQDIIDAVASTGEAFPSYVDFVRDRADKNFPLSNYTINSMSDYLNGILENKEDYYLINTLKNKIQSKEFLTAEEKDDYCKKLVEAFNENYFPGIEKLNTGILQYLDRQAKNAEGYWKTYKNGPVLYELELKKLLGITDLNMTDYIDELDAEIKETNNEVSSSINALASMANASTYAQLAAWMEKYPIVDGTPEEMLEYLKEFAKTIVPDLDHTPEITIKEMDEGFATVSNAVAYYMKSPFDSNSSEFITLNPVKLGDSNDVLETLSHEGYPGHLYAYLFSKQLNIHPISKIMTSTAHGEGWAKYVEIALLEYVLENAKSDEEKAIAKYLYASAKSSHLLETRLDVAIHIQKWSIKKISDYLDQMGYNGDAAQEIFRLLIETPVTYAAYGYGMMTFEKLHNEAKEILKENYDEVEFNTMLLSKGWTDLEILKETYVSYMKKKCHKLGIKFEA